MRVVIVGNSGSGKSTRAREIASGWNGGLGGAPVLDLDTIAWAKADGAAGPVPTRRARAEARADLERFCRGVPAWVVEGCYADLARAALEIGAADGLGAPELLWLNPGAEACVRNCRGRPWEPHKYASRAEQDANLEMLIGWVRAYAERDDDCSEVAHRALVAWYGGRKREERGG